MKVILSTDIVQSTHAQTFYNLGHATHGLFTGSRFTGWSAKEGRALTAPTQFMAALEPRNRPSQRSRCAAISTASRSVPWRAVSTCRSGRMCHELEAARHA